MILFLNHGYCQCGIYEIGQRIFGLLDQTKLPCTYFWTTPYDAPTYRSIVEQCKPTHVIYNYYPGTLCYVTKAELANFPDVKHIGIIHDPLDPKFIEHVDNTFDAWIIHDHTNPLPSKKKFTTVRPIPRFIPTESPKTFSIGSHGFTCNVWKQYELMLHYINNQFDEVEINFHLPTATFSGGDANYDHWWNQITKPGIKLNITTNYLLEQDLISFLSRNTINMYFYNTHGDPYIGVGGSADLAIASQRSLLVNSTYMYRHLHEALGFYEQTNSIGSSIDNTKAVKRLYDEWSPERITDDYLTMLGKL